LIFISAELSNKTSPHWTEECDWLTKFLPKIQKNWRMSEVASIGGKIEGECKPVSLKACMDSVHIVAVGALMNKNAPD
jgi:hypothetical protein